MKRTLLLLSMGCALCTLNNCNCQKDSTSQGNHLFQGFSGGMNALYSNKQTVGGIDLSIQTYHYYLITGKRDTKQHPRLDSTSIKGKYKGLDLYVLNRTAMNFDSIRSLADEYTTSMQASPLTFRFAREFYLFNSTPTLAASLAPLFYFVVSMDGRLVPYGDRKNRIAMGFSSHCYLTFATRFTTVELNEKGKEINKGTMYFKPSIGFALGGNEMMRSFVLNEEKNHLVSTECRMGFTSSDKSIGDYGLLVRYCITDIRGPKLRAGIVLSSFR